MEEDDLRPHQHCDNCEAALYFVFEETGQPFKFQLLDALVMNLRGGYGMYFDTMYTPPYVMFCKTCADKLVAAFPIFRERMREAEDGSWGPSSPTAEASDSKSD